MNEKIMILDTEVNDNFIYDFGFIIAEKNESGLYQAIAKYQFIVEQIYYNFRLFTTDYYKKKREEYTSLIKGRRAVVKKFGHITQIVSNIIKKYEITKIYAYNSPYDKAKMKYTCEDFKVKNPLETLDWYDLHAISNNFIHLHKSYIDFAIENNFINSSGFLETTAETTYQFLTKNIDFKEKHTSLADCEIELEILNICILNGFKEENNLKTKKIPSKNIKTLTILHNEETYKFNYIERKNSYKTDTIKLITTL